MVITCNPLMHGSPAPPSDFSCCSSLLCNHTRLDPGANINKVILIISMFVQIFLLWRMNDHERSKILMFLTTFQRWYHQHIWWPEWCDCLQSFNNLNFRHECRLCIITFDSGVWCWLVNIETLLTTGTLVTLLSCLLQLHTDQGWTRLRWEEESLFTLSSTRCLVVPLLHLGLQTWEHCWTRERNRVGHITQSSGVTGDTTYKND